MRCLSCGHVNRADLRFCVECGIGLGYACPSCRLEHEPGEKFCGQCGTSLAATTEPTPTVPVVASRLRHSPASYTPKYLAEKVLTTRSALEGERKQVTVLFADMQGSVALSERVDPETLHGIMDRFFMILADGVHRFEGTVNQYTGDGIMALFGAPIAQEDHAQRACYAALCLRDELRRYTHELQLSQGLNFSVRMGLNSGEVVVGKIGDDLRMDYTAQGHTVGLAARMEQLAEPDHVYLAQDTARLVEGFFLLRDLGELSVKGVQAPLRVYELKDVGLLRTRLDVSRVRGFSKFVGRGKETAALEAALERAVRGNAQVIGVVGEAGVGKSRLCYEFVQRCRERGLTVTETHGVAHGKKIPFLVVLKYLRSYFGTTDQDTDRSAREKIAGKLLMLDPELSDALPLLFDFLGVPDPERVVPRMDPEARQRQLFAAIKGLTHAHSRREPAVSLLEDLQWIDAGSEAFLDNWIEALAGTRSLLVVNFRPEYHAGWMQKSYYQQIPLLPLGSEAIAELLRELLGTSSSLARLTDRIRERAGGNAFFVEEVVQSLIEAGSLEGSSGAYRLVKPVDVAAIPASVQSVLAARIDRLGEQEKHVLQTASVIGRTFSEPMLKEVAELSAPHLAGSLGSLQGGEFIYKEAIYPDASYAFKHALTQEVAYRSQLKERRAKIHAALARTIVKLYPDRLDEQAALLAHHWEEAGESLEAARWHARAAQWVGLSDLAETVRHWKQVRSILKTLPESPDTCSLGMAACFGLLMGGWRMGMPEGEVEAVFTEGRELARRNGDLGSESSIVAIYAALRGGAGDMDQYVDQAREAARLAESSGDPGVMLGVALPFVYSHFCAGRLSEAWKFLRRFLDSPPEDPRLGSDLIGFSPYGWMAAVGQYIGVFMGLLDAGRAAQRRGTEIALRLGNLETLSWAYGFAVHLAEFSGETEGCLERCREGFEIAERTGSAYSRAYASCRLGLAHVVREEWAEAAEFLERGLELARQHRTGLEAEAGWLSCLALAEAGLGMLQAAQEAADQAISIAQRRGTRISEIRAQLTKARVLRQSGVVDPAREFNTALARADNLIDQTGARAYRPFVHEERASLSRLVGDETTHERELREAHRLFTEMGATGHAERLAKELGL